MAELLDDVSYLSQEIGPRPAGTEEEQQAALYIADKVHERTGFHAEIEDIRCMAYSELVDCIYFAAATVLLALAFFLPVTSIVTFVLAAIVAVLYCVERIQKRPVIGKLLTRDISQNVVVKYKPGTTAAQAARPRKIVVVANYDSGRVRRDASLRLAGLSAMLTKAAAGSLVASPLLILLRNIVLAGSLGAVNAVFSLLCVVALIFLVLQLVLLLVHRLATFNEAANNNASSVAVMLEVLRRIDGTAAPENAPRKRDVAPAGKPEQPVVHGEQEARAAGVVPEGAALSYDEGVEPNVEPANPAAPVAADEEPVQAVAQPQPAASEDDSAAARLRSAKAAIAALTGEAVGDDIFLDLEEKREAAAASATQAASFLDRLEEAAQAADAPAVQPEAPAAPEAPVEDAAQPAEPEPEAQQPEPEPVTDASVPAWYLAARAKANRPVDMPVRRSRYADDADALARERSQRASRSETLVDEQTEERLRQMRESFAAPAPAEHEAEPAVQPQQLEAEQQPVQEPQPEARPAEPQQPAAAEQPAEDLEVTAAFPPVGDKGETVAFEPEFELDDEAQPVQPVQAEAEDDIIEIDEYEDVIEAPFELIEEDDEYDGYSDEEAVAEPEDDYGEPEEEPAGERPGLLGRFGRRQRAEADDEPKEGLFSRLRNAVMPADEPFEDEFAEDEPAEDAAEPVAAPEEPLQPAGEDFQAPLPGESQVYAAEAEPAVEDYAEDGYGEAYDDAEDSRFEQLRDRFSGAFSRLTSRIAPPPDFEEEDYSYEEEDAYEPLADYVSADEAQPVEPAFGEEAEAPAPLVEDTYDEAAEYAPAEQPQGEVAAEDEAAYDEAAYDEPAYALAEDAYAQSEAYAEPFEAEAPAYAEEQQPIFEADEAPVSSEYYEADGYAEDDAEPAPAFNAGNSQYADELADDDYIDDGWEDEEPARGGFMQRLSGFWNRLTNRGGEDNESYEDYAYDDEYAEEPLAGEQPAVEPEPQPQAPAPAFAGEELVYQSAYAPKRAAFASSVAAPAEEPAPVAEQAYGFESETPAEPEALEPVAEAAIPEEAFEPLAEDEPDTAGYEEPAAAEEEASFEPLADPDMAYQQVMAQPGDGDREIPVAIPAARPTADRSRSANPRVGLRQRVAAAMSSWEEPVTPAATAPFTPVSSDLTAPFDAVPADEDVLAEAFDDSLDVVPVESPELDAQADVNELFVDESALGGTIAMAPIDVSQLRGVSGETVEEPLFEEVMDADLPEPELDSRVQLPEIPLQAQQNAPLAQASQQDDRAAAKQRLSSMIPAIDIAKPEAEAQQEPLPLEDAPSRTERMRRLRADLPSMSGRIAGAPQAGEGGLVSQTGSFAAVSATGNIDPVGDELVEELPPEEIYVEDADDSVYGEASFAETGAYLASDYVKMPEKRRGLFGRRKRRDAQDEISPQQWLGVSDDFDARAVGRARGDWSSFQENDERGSVGDRNQGGQETMWRADRGPAASDYDTGLDSAFNDDEDDFLDDDYGMNNGRWNGGAFSGRRSSARMGERDRYDAYDDSYDYGGYSRAAADDEYAEFAEYADENYDENAFLSELEYEDSLENGEKGGRLKTLTARFSRKDREAAPEPAEDRRAPRGRERSTAPSEDDAWNVAAARAAARSAVANVIDDPRVQEELGETYGFVDDAIANEVWFVALGAGGADNAGMEAFLDAHGDELRGAMVINLEGIGDGELVGMASEGLLRKYKPTTRMKRFLRNAGQATGVRVGQAQMNWRDSAATVSMRRGIPTITVAGADGDVPVRYASSDDVVDKLDENTLKQRVNFILELLRTI